MSSIPGILGLERAVEIGRGGFGTVYRAEEPEFGRSVAVKVIHDRLNDADVRRAFLRECQAMGKLSGHPHIVTVHRGGTTELGEPYIVMDLMAGGSLQDRVTRGGPMSWPETLEIGIAIAGALETAHRAGILHLDVKPANVLVSGYGEPKLADFGISRMPGLTTTFDGRIRASIAYAPPERLLDGTATPASDVYSLGATLYALMAGRPARDTDGGLDILALIGRIAREPAPDLRPHGVPEPVARVIGRMMAGQPAERYRTAADAALALQETQRLTGRPVSRLVVAGELPATPPTRVVERPVLAAPGTPPPTMPAPRGAPWTPAPSPSQPPDPGTGMPAAERPRHRMRKVVIAAAAALVGAVLLGAVLLPGRSSTGPDVPVATSADPPITTEPVPTSTDTPAPVELAIGSEATHPAAEVVAGQLQGYLRAVNDHDYSAAFSYFTPASSVAQAGFETFSQGYSTTTVLDPYLESVQDSANGLVATVTYRSNQDPAFGPEGQSCSDWHIAYELVNPDLLIERARLVEPPRACS